MLTSHVSTFTVFDVWIHIDKEQLQVQMPLPSLEPHGQPYLSVTSPHFLFIHSQCFKRDRSCIAWSIWWNWPFSELLGRRSQNRLADEFSQDAFCPLKLAFSHVLREPVLPNHSNSPKKQTGWSPLGCLCNGGRDATAKEILLAVNKQGWRASYRDRKVFEHLSHS